MTPTAADIRAAKMRTLFSDFGYSFDGKTLWRESAFKNGPREFCGRFSSHFHAADWLMPIINDDRFYDRLQRARK